MDITVRSLAWDSANSVIAIKFSRLRFVDDLSRSIELLQRKSVVGQIRVPTYGVRCKGHGLPSDLRGFLIFSLTGIHYAQTSVHSGLPRVARNLLLKRLGGLVQFSGYLRVVVGGEVQLFHLAGMLPQLECFGQVLAGPRHLP